MFRYNFGKYEPFFKVFHHQSCQESEIYYVNRLNISTSPVACCYNKVNATDFSLGGHD